MINSAIPADKRHLAFATLFLTEMWEKFSNFGLRALLVLYFVQAWHWSDQQSYAVFGVYVSLLCLTPVLGGYLSDRVLGRKLTTLVGGCLILLGHLCITFLQDGQFMFGLTNVIIGTGLMVPSMCSLVGLLYANDKPRHDRAFTLFYMGVNVGGILASVVVGFVAHLYGWHVGFSLAALGMLIALATFLFGWRYLTAYIEEPQCPRLTPKRLFVTAISLLGLIFLCCYLFSHPDYIIALVVAMVVLCGLLFVQLFQNADSALKKNLWLLVLLYALTVCFFIMYEQSGTSLMLFTERVIDRHIGGLMLPTPVVTAMNPIYIIVFAALTARITKPTVLVKVAIGLILTAVSFLLLAFAATLHYPNLMWLALAVLLSSIGELFIGPVVLAAISQLAPKRFNSTLMGIWFMTGSIATYLAIGVAKLTSIGGDVAVNDQYAQVFRSVGYYGLAVGIIAFCILGYFKYRESKKALLLLDV